MPANRSPVETPYAKKTFGDRSRVKRYLQQKRLRDALTLTEGLPGPRMIIDFGAGNGEFCKLLSGQFPEARIVCYEPHPGLQQQARDNLSSYPGIEYAQSPQELPGDAADLVFCLEVFEHLPPRESEDALNQIQKTLNSAGHAVIGVPVEVGLPALFKGLFRMIRRRGDYDARLSNILSSTIGNPPKERPTVELMPGSHYHLHHIGFDHRTFRSELRRHFREVCHSCSPFGVAGPSVNAEINLLLVPRA